MRPTHPPLIVTLVLVGAAVGWGLFVVVDGWTGRSLPVPVLAGSALWLLGIALIVWGSVIRPRLRANIDRRKSPGVDPLPILVAARVAAVAMAASRVGALITGLYAGITIATVASGLTTPATQQTLLAAVLAASGAAVVAGAGLRLERWCLLPGDDDDDDS
jgi:Kef-type K+ transport system membrane component KefB